VKLTKFQIFNYRSVNDSGPIDVSKITALVGRNESGKTNLLLALHSLNPPGGPKDLSPIKDFPRHRRLSECTDDTPVIETTWELSGDEQAKLSALFPRSKGIANVTIGRRYKSASRWVSFPGLGPLEFDIKTVTSRVRKIKPIAMAAAGKLEASPRKQLEDAIGKFETGLSEDIEAMNWAAMATPAIAAFRQALASANVTLTDKENQLLDELDEMAAAIPADEKAHAEARKWILGLLPVFVYVDEYPEIDGHQNITDYLNRKNSNQLTPADRNFEKLCKVADLNPQQLQELLGKNDHETRNQLANRAGAVVTGEIRRLWKDRALKIRFNPDAQHLDTFVSDPNAVYDVEVNLDERSRGFKWFFSFYVTFAADTKGGSAENAILLLDEPGLYLHATSQSDLLKHLSTDFTNQVLYTTHSPFMVPTDNLDAVRTVNIDQDAGTTVSNDPSGDSRTLFPLQAALGFNLAQSLFVGPANLVVEGVTDYWIMSSISEYLRSVGKTALPTALTITPAGGAQKVSYMVALLTAERLNVLVLLDEERQARTTRDELVKQKLIRDDNVVFVTDAFDAASRPVEADIEDLIDEAAYKDLVQESYAAELAGKTLNLNAKLPRIVKRYEEAFKVLGLEFHKTRPARLLLNRMATDPGKVMTTASTERFERLFGVVAKAFEKHTARNAEPFR
jgi:energy-coupling factor transporter ATP-binding protein EcfA2